MTLVKYKPQAYYLARLDAATGARREHWFCQSQEDWNLYEETRRRTKLEYGYRYLLTDLRKDAADAVAYEAGEKAHFTCYKLGERVASGLVDLPAEAFLNGLTEDQRQTYWLGYRKGVGLTCYTDFFRNLLAEFAGASN
ncbi:MAG: hypothetical protein SFV17_11455 [Candidatus Obscuribacter sp.]|nr:hypothetical protein [Candidatus Obscuribacter sp.]